MCWECGKNVTDVCSVRAICLMKGMSPQLQNNGPVKGKGKVVPVLFN